MIGIAPYEKADSTALVQVHHAARDADQVVDVGLKKLIAWIGLQHVQHGLAVVTLRVEAEVLHHTLDFPTQYRNVPRAAVIRGRRPKAEETVLAGDLAAGVECFHADVIEVFVAMDCRG